MDRKIINISDSDLAKMKIPSSTNNVIIEITERSKDKQTKGGIFVGFDEDVTHAEGDTSHEADIAEVWGIVHKVPDNLYYRKWEPDSMPWETTIEIQVGDTVWFDYMESVNCDVLKCGSRLFYVILYRDLYVARRRADMCGATATEDKIIPLNGYCLCEPIQVEKKSEFALDTEGQFRTDRTKIKYLATPNGRYQPNDYIYGTYNNDDIDVLEGDIVHLRENYVPYHLERLDSIATFSDEPYYVIQRRFMNFVI